jgi:hypothetical protein
MSTGADCRFTEKQPGKWYYELQQYPYGSNPNYDTFGPFPTFRRAADDLHNNHANPGGYSVHALPGCKHDLTRKREFVAHYETVTHECDRCGAHLDLRSDTEKAKFKRESLWARDSIQFPRLLAEINAVGLSKKQRADLRKSMDITDNELDDLLSRAERAWEEEKERYHA